MQIQRQFQRAGQRVVRLLLAHLAEQGIGQAERASSSSIRPVVELEQVIAHQRQAGLGEAGVTRQRLFEMVLGVSEADVGINRLLLEALQVAVVGGQVGRADAVQVGWAAPSSELPRAFATSVAISSWMAKISSSGRV